MNKALSVLGWLLFVLTVLLPVCILISACFGYSLSNYFLFAVLTALASVAVTVLSLIFRNQHCNNTVSVLFAISAPLSLINLVFYLFKSNSFTVVLCLAVCFGCSCFLTVRHGKPTALKTVSLILSALMVFPICFLSFMYATFGQIGQNTVVETVYSPDGNYYAELIDSDQGALGGDTAVYVYEDKMIDTAVFRLYKSPKLVYLGEWREYEDMEIYFKDEHCLIINSKEYDLK